MQIDVLPSRFVIRHLSENMLLRDFKSHTTKFCVCRNKEQPKTLRHIDIRIETELNQMIRTSVPLLEAFLRFYQQQQQEHKFSIPSPIFIRQPDIKSLQEVYTVDLFMHQNLKN